MVTDNMINTILQGDVLEQLRLIPDSYVNCIVTSPPYWGLRDYNVDNQIGLEDTPDNYVMKLVQVFRECKRVLRDDGTLWLNLGDSYCSSPVGHKTVESLQKSSTLNIKYKVDHLKGAKFDKSKIKGLKPKDLIGIPWRVALALQADGWYLRCDIIWHKPNPMPCSCTDRPTISHEYIFLLSKSQNYYYDIDAIRERHIWANKDSRFGKGKVLNKSGKSASEGSQYAMNGTSYHLDGRNKRSVWTICTKPYAEAHFATYPEELIKPCILAGCPQKGIVLDTFFGAGTTGLVARKHDRNFIGIELNPEYVKIAQKRLHGVITQKTIWEII